MRIGSADTKPKPHFRILCVGHDPRDPAEASLALAAAASLSGWRADGDVMPNGEFGHPPSLQAIARELGLHVGAVRRGVRHLQATGDVRLWSDGVHVEPEGLRRRWENHRQRVRLGAPERQLGLRAQPLLLVALVAGQVDQQGRVCLGVEFLMERTGFARRTVERALATARAVGAIHTWSVPLPGGGHRRQLFLAMGPSRSGGSNASQRGGSDELGQPLAASPAADAGDGVAFRRPAPSQSGGRPHREAAVTPSQSGGRHPDCPPERPPDSPPDALARDLDLQAPASPAGETRGRSEPSGERRDRPNKGTREIVEDWILAYAKKGIERLEEQHAVEVAGLLDQLGPDHGIRDHDELRAGRRRSAARAERVEMARQVIRWCPSPERLGRWLVRALTEFRVENLGAYLREACSKGDPGTLLEAHAKNQVGRAAEVRQDFSQRTEALLEGPRSADVAELIAGTTAVFEADDPERDRLREQLRRLLRDDRVGAARAVLVQLVAGDRSDVGIARAIGDACTLAKAKELLAA